MCSHVVRWPRPPCFGKPPSLPFRIWKCLSSSALQHSLLKRDRRWRGWVDETWSHSGRWWHWQERPVTLNCLSGVEAREICSWRLRAAEGRERWSSGLVRTNTSTYGQMMRCDVSPGYVDRTCRVMTWIHIPSRRASSAVFITKFCCLHRDIHWNCTRVVLGHCQHLTWYKLTCSSSRFQFQSLCWRGWKKKEKKNEGPMITYSVKRSGTFSHPISISFSYTGRSSRFQI